MRRGGCLYTILTNAFLAAVILLLYTATQQGGALRAVPAAAVYRGAECEKIALQFSVGWNAAAISGIMDTLKQKDAKVTFAVSGEWAADNPDTLRRMVSDGHEIATLGSHPDMDGRLSWVVEDVRRSLGVIESLCKERPKLYYAGGRSQTVSARAAQKLGIKNVACTIDLLCAKGSAADILSRLPKEPIGGSIILLQPTSACAEALEGILAALEEKGLPATFTSDVLG